MPVRASFDDAAQQHDAKADGAEHQAERPERLKRGQVRVRHLRIRGEPRGRGVDGDGEVFEIGVEPLLDFRGVLVARGFDHHRAEAALRREQPEEVGLAHQHLALEDAVRDRGDELELRGTPRWSRIGLSSVSPRPSLRMYCAVSSSAMTGMVLGSPVDSSSRSHALASRGACGRR